MSQELIQEKLIREDLRTGIGTEGSLLIPDQIHGTLLPEYEKALLPREMAALYIGPGMIKGSDYNINLETVNVMDVRQVGEGSEIPLETPEYSNVNIKPLKYGLRINITSEMEEDSQFALLPRAVVIAALRFAENENSLVITALDGAANTVSGGSAVTLANATRAIQYLEDSDAVSTDWIVGAEVAKDLRDINSLFEADRSGGNSVLNSSFVTSIYGMRVWKVSSNAGMTATSSYVIDRKHAYAITEKRALTVRDYDLATHDLRGVALTHRIAIALLRSTAVAKITSS